MSRSAGTPINPTKEGSTTSQSPSDLPIRALHSSYTSSSGGSSIDSSSSTSSRRHLSSGNTSPPCTLAAPSNSAEEREHHSKLHFSPASRGILHQSLDIDQHRFSDTSSRAHRQHERSSNSRGGEGSVGGLRSSEGSAIDTTMHSAAAISTAASSSSLPFQDNHKYTDAASIDRSSANGSSNGQRPANKARRTSSGGSRVPGEDVGRRKAGSSASDSGSDWPHGPKVPLATNPSLAPPPAPIAESSSRATNTEADEQVASTSSNYFTSDLNTDRNGSKANGRDASHPHLDLAAYPPQDLLRILASLLSQIATANDHIRPKSSAPASEDGKQRRRDQNSSGQDSRLAASSSGGSFSSAQQKTTTSTTTSRRPSLSSLSPTRHDRPTTAALSALETASSTLCFHARNIPSISIESYLLRILKYCPATNEVFLSLLIYFDRMSKMGSSASLPSQSANTTSELDMADGGGEAQSEARQEKNASGAEDNEDETFAGMRGFAIDSYNVHRLVIAGVTVASKFFSDVFYTNSRYAKVGGLPVHELNQLELQFLLLNDFSLVIPLEEMQRYADQLLIYGGLSKAAWSDLPPMEGAKVSGTTTDRSAFGAVSRQERRDQPM
jgi:hypothetical protein